MPRSSLLFALFLFAGCRTSSLPLPSDSDGGASDLGAACSAAHDTASCQAIPGCKAVGCPSCEGDGGLDFVECVAPGQPYGLDCPAACAQPACTDLQDGPSCDARPDCFALYSGNLPCDSSGCLNHFVKCQSGVATCMRTGPCSGSCVMDTPSCPSGEVEVYPAQNCCAIGCVAPSKCDPLGG
jgi:hypothetical protein